MGWAADVVVGVVFPVLCVHKGTWRAVCGVGAADMHHLCFPIAMYSMYMEMGDGAGGTPVARLGGCGLCAWGLPNTSSVREVTGHPSLCVGGGCVCLPVLSPWFPTSICVVSSCMCSGGKLMWFVRWGRLLTWWWGLFSVCFVCTMGHGVLCAELVPCICAVYVFR